MQEKMIDAGSEEKQPSVALPLFTSLWVDEGRRALSMLLAFTLICIIAAIVVNLSYKPFHKLGEFSGFSSMQDNYERLFIPIGFLLALVSLLLFSLSGSYGHYTEITLGKKTIPARKFFRSISFYSAILGAALLLSGGIVNAITSRF
ncbi:MAG: hypothetical protein ABIF01_00580 [Candidatus Micrarchaeota archaeon]